MTLLLLLRHRAQAVSEALAAEDAEVAGGTGTEEEEEPHEADNNNSHEATARFLKETQAK